MVDCVELKEPLITVNTNHLRIITQLRTNTYGFNQPTHASLKECHLPTVTTRYNPDSRQTGVAAIAAVPAVTLNGESDE